MTNNRFERQPAEGSRKVVEDALRDQERRDRHPQVESSSESGRTIQQASDLTTGDFGADRMGNNQLQGNDQTDVQNQRNTVPDEKQEPDDVLESFEKLDKDVRARRDLGKKG